MFQRYDTDGNGQIDKEEFRAVVKKMKSSSRRREIISVAAATFGSLVSNSLCRSFMSSLKYSQCSSSWQAEATRFNTHRRN